MDAHFFNGIFDDGIINEDRIDAAGVRIMELVEADGAEARKAAHLLQDILLLAIADGRAVNPQSCATHYFVVERAAFGSPTLLDQIKGE
jgi:hypothetical protein